MSLSIENADRSSVQFSVGEEAGQFVHLRSVEDASAQGESPVYLGVNLHIENGGAKIKGFSVFVEEVCHAMIVTSCVKICNMPYITINDADIYYQEHGDVKGTPILLIHGSTIDSHTDWDSVIPALAKEYKVFAPDCRGHGRSNNPRMSYSFKELADDAAAFVRAMGYAKAHIIGHSNGGNVVLVTAMEHPEVTQTCIPQAANAYVTRYLVEREPMVFDPERVEREAPEWRDEMIALHEAVNGVGYWRDLLFLTLKELISEPNYSPADLARVNLPMLVIMGAEDAVNAPDEHAQYIANHVPNAELWIPEKTGHNVHKDRDEEWLAKVLDFLKRRG
jgi:pimeloyl-ACP methyl ester carboxylesterase